MNRNEYILKLKSLRSIIDKQLLIESENDKWYNAHSSEVQKEINFCRNCKTASPKELQSHLESASKLLTDENYKVLKEIGPKVKVGSPKQADYLNKATKALKALSKKVKNNYHLESVEMSKSSKILIILGITLILVSVILCGLFGKKYFVDLWKNIFSLANENNVKNSIDLMISNWCKSRILGLCIMPGVLGVTLLVGVYGQYLKAKTTDNNFLKIFDSLSDKVYYY